MVTSSRSSKIFYLALLVVLSGGVGEGLRGSSGEWCWSVFIISGSLSILFIIRVHLTYLLLHMIKSFLY